MFDPTQPSPTSKLGINVRTYRIEEDRLGLAVDIDLGTELEAMAEMLYDGYNGPDGIRGFEKLTRMAVQESLAMDLILAPMTLFVATASGRPDLAQKMSKHRMDLSLALSSAITTMMERAGVRPEQMRLMRKFF